MKTMRMITNGSESNYLISDGAVNKFVLQSIANFIELFGGDVIGIDGVEGIEFYAEQMNVQLFIKRIKSVWNVNIIDDTAQ